MKLKNRKGSVTAVSPPVLSFAHALAIKGSGNQACSFIFSSNLPGSFPDSVAIFFISDGAIWIFWFIVTSTR